MMSPQFILMGGPRSGQMYEVSEHFAEVGTELLFNVWPPFPLTESEADDAWPETPRWQEVYSIETKPSCGVPGVAVYTGRRP